MASIVLIVFVLVADASTIGAFVFPITRRVGIGLVACRRTPA
jgi:hypothetical protein